MIMRRRKKKSFTNILLLIFLIALIVVAYFLYGGYKEKAKQDKIENANLIEIDYGSDVVQIGSTKAGDILDTFIGAFNEHDGATVASIMDLVANYIYKQCEKDGSNFDEKYVEILSNPSGYDNLLEMQYELKAEENATIQAINSFNVQLTLVNHSDIQSTSKYLAKMTAKIRTVVPEEKVDEVDNLEFLLLKKNDAYYIMDYYLADDNKTNNSEVENLELES